MPNKDWADRPGSWEWNQEQAAKTASTNPSVSRTLAADTSGSLRAENSNPSSSTIEEEKPLIGGDEATLGEGHI